MKSLTRILLFCVVLAICTSGAHAFGAGNIPNFAYMDGKAFRHGDIEDTLAEIVKKAAGGGFAIGSLLGHSKFNGLDIKRVYFGNWLRDCSQAVDIASLKKLQLQTIINLCMVMGFMAHGYATHEFEVTVDRLGVYLPTEHIDNPKGYGGGEDPRKYDPRLRGPVDPRELEIDPRTGMKNYIANESETWDTSKALVRRTLQKCIQLGRQHRSTGQKADEYEAYRLLGQALHTLEDFSAHSNFCELALIAQGHTQVFSHVGDHVKVTNRQGKQVAPLVTGSFGSSDFIHSLLGEATDHLSEASVSDLNKELSRARSKDMGSSTSSSMREMFFSLPGNSGGEMSREMETVERIRDAPSQGKRPEDMSPQELHAVLWQVLTFRDSVVKKISKTIEKIPGLGPLIDKLMESIQVFVFTTLEPYLKPIIKTASSGLSSASSEVINNQDQYEVFNDPMASDPTHSFLSKDHFNLILNEPAGHIAKIIVLHTVTLVIRAWDNSTVNVDQVTEDVLQCLFHPDFHDPNSKIQREMLQYMHTWTNGLGHKQHEIIGRLSMDAVRNHRNVRLGGEGGVAAAEGTAASNLGHQFQHNIQGHINQIPGVSQVQGVYNTLHGFSGGGGPRRDVPSPSAGGYAPPHGKPPAHYSSSPPAAAPVTTGSAAEFYQSSQYPRQEASVPSSQYNSPPFPPGSPPSFPSAPTPFSSGGYAPPSFPPGPGMMSGGYNSPPGPPPEFPGGPPGAYGGGPPPFPPPNQGPPSGYNPGYNPGYNYQGGSPSGGW